ncbi:MAG: MraY family glycosyltransferase [Endomicrobiia bacterium]|nr:MraY family glycosyltransferase [Endomicrobiia bacterium]
MLLYLTTFIASFAGAVVFVPVSILLARKFDVLDHPRARKVHRLPLPRWGGIGIYLGIASGIVAACYIFPSFRELLTHNYKGIVLEKQLRGIAFGATVAVIIGAVDDKKNIRAATKLLAQIIAAYVAMDFGVRIFGLTIPFHKTVAFPQILQQLVTVLWIIGFMNTINLADGLDGLAAGIVAIAAAAFFAVSVILSKGAAVDLSRQLTLSAVLSLGVAGSSLGFLAYNFPPARVFMGDSGALMLGFMLATISATGTLKSTAFLSLFIPITVVAMPILDVCLSIFRRWRKGVKLSTPDKEHIHHKFLEFGWTQREVVLLMYVLTLILANLTVILTIIRK